MKKIVLTGGPCAGKSTALKFVKDHLEQTGYKVYTIYETATELIKSGADNKTNQRIFQPHHVVLQIEKENIIESIARKENPSTESVIIVCDRATIDAHAFCTDNEFDYVLGTTGYTENQLLERYDAIFHLDTAPEHHYTLENNEARSETHKQAQKVNERNHRVWSNHPNLSRIENKQTFNEKMEDLLAKIDSFLNQEVINK